MEGECSEGQRTIGGEEQEEESGGGTVINGRMNQIAGVWNYNEVNQQRIVIQKAVK